MKFSCIGDVGVDRYLLNDDHVNHGNVNHGNLFPGGCTLNVAVHLRRVLEPEHEVRVFTALGMDVHSRMLREVIQREKLACELVMMEGSTPYSQIQIGAGGERFFKSYDPGVLRDYRPAPEATRLLGESDWVVTLIFEQVMGFFESVIEIPRRGGLCVDFMDMKDFGKNAGIVRRFVSRLDLAFFGLSRTDDRLIADLRELAFETKKLFVITLGPAGSVAFDGVRGRIFEGRARVVQALDTTGAGDSFLAGFIKTYALGLGVPEGLAAGHELAASTVQRLGSI